MPDLPEQVPMTRKIPSHEQTYATVREMILFGELAPGQAVTIQGLVERLGAGMTPVREAIRRLTAEGALTPQGNRRVSVPRLDLARLDEVTFARLAIEPQLVERAAPAVTPALIARLEQIDAEVDAAITRGAVQHYLAANHRFHFTLYEAASADVLLSLARMLWLRVGPSLRVVCDGDAVLSLPDGHRAALAAMRLGDTGALVQAITDDIRQGSERVAAAIARGQI
ncbi:GntR family transcriptional regulator [Alkalilacustris brevis]|uniref:GntR family transcriptional regulator n=1 Tax=Alkalilacustris brevis TaxID=2026338 RepID=UPI00192E6808|nr:GntR family transcriptional regulator [Alkalilacustris brevis]